MIVYKEGKSRKIAVFKFLRTYKVMTNYVQDTIKRLLEKDFVSNELGEYSVYYQFFEI